MAVVYSVTFAPGAERDLRRARVPCEDFDRIIAKAEALALDPRPHGSEKIQGGRGVDVRRLRVGNYRVVYEVRDQDQAVEVFKVDTRGNVYRRLERRLKGRKRL